MALSRGQVIVSSVFLAVAMGTVVTLYYRASTGGWEGRREEHQRRADAAQPIRRTTVMADRLVLIKDEPATMGRTRLIYRGIADGRIHIDVYLLDLDPDYPYARHVSKAEARRGIRLGDRNYRMDAASRKSLVLLFAG